MTVDPLIQLLLRAGLALLLTVAALHKLRDPGAFRRVLAGYRILPDATLAAAAALLAIAEAALALALLHDATLTAASAGAVGLFSIYAAAIAINLARGRRHIDCGCVGPAAGNGLGAWLLVRNAVLIAAGAALWLPTTARSLVWVDAVTLAGALSLVALLWISTDLLVAYGGRDDYRGRLG